MRSSFHAGSGGRQILGRSLVALLSACLTASGKAAESPSHACFRTAVQLHLPANAFAFSLAVADFNNDAKPDIASAAIPRVFVAIGDGEGRFAPAIESELFTNGAPVSIDTGDFNQDGNTDVAVAIFDANVLDNNAAAVLLGDGTGHLATPVFFPVGLAARYILVRDLNGDGLLDLTVANQGSASVSLLMGDGHGGFSPPVNQPVGAEPSSIAASDFNHDGVVDLAVAAAGFDSVSILIGNGGGTFAAATQFAAGIYPISIAAGDFNGDGDDDLVVVNNTYFQVSVLLGDGKGGFGSPVSFETGVYPISVAIGDLDKDGKPDLVVSNYSSDDITILRGDGSGSFSSDTSLHTGSRPLAVALADFDRNSFIDIVVPDSGSDTISSFLNLNGSDFRCVMGFRVGDFPVDSAPGDFNGDGRTDVAVADFESDTITILAGDGLGYLRRLNAVPSVGPIELLARDFDEDGRLDLVIANGPQGAVTFRAGAGDGGFQSARDIAHIDNPAELVGADLNGDEHEDIAILGNQSDIQVLLGSGTGTFSLFGTLTLPAFGGAFSVGDLDLDGDLDLVASTQEFSSVTVVVYRGDGTGAFTLDSSFPTVAESPATVYIADLNRDSRPDIVIVDLVGRVTVHLATPAGTFGTPISTPVLNFGISSAMADYNDDGLLDFAITNHIDNNVAVLSGDGSGGFSSPALFPSPVFPTSVVATDMNSDSRPDLLITGSTREVAVYLNSLFELPSFLPEAIIGVPFTPNLAPSGGWGPFTFTLAGALPEHLVLDSRGVFSGLPETLGSFPVGITATDPNGCAATREYVLTVRKGETDISVDPSPKSISFGEILGLSVVVSAVPPATGTPSGLVVTSIDGILRADATLQGGAAVLSVVALSVGLHQVTIAYTGDARFSSSTEQLAVEVVRASTTTTLISSSNPSRPGSLVTLSAAVNSPPGAGAPTGSVVFRDGQTILATVELLNQHAAFQTNSLASGAHRITAEYLGNEDFETSRSDEFLQVVGVVDIPTLGTFAVALLAVALVAAGCSTLVARGPR